ncbi:AraC family transcriptional regulator [Actinophytocola sediminis]
MGGRGLDGWSSALSRRDVELPAGDNLVWPAAPALSAHVLGYAGSRHTDDRPVLHRVTPVAGLTVLLDLEPAQRWYIPGNSGQRQLVSGSPVDGLRAEPVVFEQSGRDHSMTIGLTPLGAYALFGLPLKELSQVDVGIVDLLGARAAHLIEELAHIPAWPARFALLDRRLAEWLRTGPALDAPVLGAWRRLITSGGRQTIGALAEEIGWSRPHLESRFHRQVGLPPKSVARIARFHRALRLLSQPHAPRLADIATACGYVDQPHLNRDFRAFTGSTPTRFRGLARQTES